MINLILGTPGGGKSYEAVVYHILPALSQGRKVITNLALNIEAFRALDPTYPSLIEIRTRTLAKRPTRSIVPFSNREDYGDPWRHPENGAGPLYVIDECHLALPRQGTPIEVEEWYSLHRHESADVLLITQSYGKINKSIRDLVQVVYRVRKNTIFGSQSTYTRKVQDGLRGEVVHVTQRKYDRRYFRLYQSHTLGGGAELAPQDIRPIWRHWGFVGAAACFMVASWMAAQGWLNPFRASDASDQVAHASPSPAPAPASVPVRAFDPVPAVDKPSAPVVDVPPVPDRGVDELPFGRVSLHVSGYVRSEVSGRVLYLFTASQNGQAVFVLTAQELQDAGYLVESLGPCAVRVSYRDWEQYVICDTPRVGVGGVIGRVSQDTVM